MTSNHRILDVGNMSSFSLQSDIVGWLAGYDGGLTNGLDHEDRLFSYIYIRKTFPILTDKRSLLDLPLASTEAEKGL